MATTPFDEARAIADYTELMRLIRVGAYQKSDEQGNYAEDGIEKSADELSFRAAEEGLVFSWHEDTKSYTLEPMADEQLAVFKAITGAGGKDCQYCQGKGTVHPTYAFEGEWSEPYICHTCKKDEGGYTWPRIPTDTMDAIAI